MTARITPYSAIVWPSCLRQLARASSRDSERFIFDTPPFELLTRAKVAALEGYEFPRGIEGDSYVSNRFISAAFTTTIGFLRDLAWPRRRSVRSMCVHHRSAA